MSTYFLAIGINHYTDRAFRALSCCENDATELHSLFKRNLELGDRARKLVGTVSIADVKKELRRIEQEIRNGDTFVFFFAGHGYQHPRREDQFLLFPDAEARLVNKGFLDGMLSLSALCELTSEWSGVSRVFILDACRSWLPGRGSEGARFDNEKALAYISSRDPAFGQSLPTHPDNKPSQGGAFPPVILNATRNGQEARELEDHQRGVLALALEQSLESQQQSGQVIYISDHLIGDIGRRMNDLLQQGRLGVEQTPFLTPPSARVLLFKPKRASKVSRCDDESAVFLVNNAGAPPLGKNLPSNQHVADGLTTEVHVSKSSPEQQTGFEGAAIDSRPRKYRKDLVIGLVLGCTGFAFWKLYLLYIIEKMR